MPKIINTTEAIVDMEPSPEALATDKPTDAVIDKALAQMADEVKNAPRHKIRIPKLPGNSEPEVYVGINGHSFRIQRGETVEVPECVIQLLEQQGVL